MTSLMVRNSRRGFEQNQAWFWVKSSVILSKIKRDFGRNQAWFFLSPLNPPQWGTDSNCRDVACRVPLSKIVNLKYKYKVICEE